MTVVKPSPMRSGIEDTPTGREIVIPSKGNMFILLFLSVWLVGWAFGEFSALNEVLHHKAGVDSFLVVWLVMWTIGGSFAVLIWLWNLSGKERIILDTSYLSIRREIFGYGPCRQYELQHIRNVRVSNTGHNIFDPRSGLRFWGLGGGAIAFDYGAETIRFGGSVSESEAAMIIDKLKERYTFS